MAGYSRLQFVFFLFLFLFLLASMCAIQVSMIAFRHVTFGVPRPTDPMIVSSYAKYVVLGVFVFHQAPLAGGEGSLKQPRDCDPACRYRCSKASDPGTLPIGCLLRCFSCCGKCLCVPSGTSGNKEECPCYNNWTFKKSNEPYCP
ncbi:hypothetical protein C3L33_07297, partial [Rhododendron williamsianum]